MSNSALRARFDRCDRDGDGRIDEHEFGLLLDRLGLGFSPAQVRAAFLAVDVNHSGYIDYEEFCKWWTHA